MDIIDLVFLFLLFGLGVIIGSFLNVVVYRIGSGTRLTGRSKCLSCGRTLRASMLVPLLSFLMQKGKCAYCGVRISYQYPLVEIATGLLFVLSALVNHFTFLQFSSLACLFFVSDSFIWSILILISVYDFKHKIIPDRLTLLFVLGAGVSLVFKMQYGLLPETIIPILDSIPWWIDVATAPLLFIPFALLFFLSGGRAMGFGDAKLSWGIGWFLGFSGGISAVVFAFWIALFPSLLLLFLRRKQFTMKSEIPFAPFLVIGTLVVYALGVNILTWTL